MARPPKAKKVYEMPKYRRFGAIDKKAEKVINISIEQFEAIRLIDRVGLTQVEAAKQMDVARTTLQRLYDSGRIKLAIALVDGCELDISGGNYEICKKVRNCSDCCSKNKNSFFKECNIMRIAVACMGKNVSEHFGHCENFTFFDAENGKIVAQNSVPSPEHKPGRLPNFLHDQGAVVVIAGGMGPGAIDIFNAHNIEVIVGARGDAKTAVENYLAGDLKSTGSVCHSHSFDD